jgi:hypothetical protein
LELARMERGVRSPRQALQQLQRSEVQIVHTVTVLTGCDGRTRPAAIPSHPLGSVRDERGSTGQVQTRRGARAPDLKGASWTAH